MAAKNSSPLVVKGHPRLQGRKGQGRNRMSVHQLAECSSIQFGPYVSDRLGESFQWMRHKANGYLFLGVPVLVVLLFKESQQFNRCAIYPPQKDTLM